MMSGIMDREVVVHWLITCQQLAYYIQKNKIQLHRDNYTLFIPESASVLKISKCRSFRGLHPLIHYIGYAPAWGFSQSQPPAYFSSFFYSKLTFISCFLLGSMLKYYKQYYFFFICIFRYTCI